MEYDLKHMEVEDKFRTSPVAEAYDNAVATRCGSEDSEETTPLGSETDAGSDDIDLRFARQEWIREIQRFEAEAGGAVKREQDLLRQLYEARTHIIKKEQEVCDLQAQLAVELREKQNLLCEVISRDDAIFHLQAFRAGPQDAVENRNAWKMTNESRCSSKAGSVRITKLATSHCSNPLLEASNPMEPALPAADSRQVKEDLLQTNFRCVRASMQPNHSDGALLEHQSKFHAWKQSNPKGTAGNAMAGNAVADVNQVMQRIQQARSARRSATQHQGVRHHATVSFV